MRSSPTVVMEEPAAGPVPLLVHPGWAARWPWLVQGTTARGAGEGWDLALFGKGAGGIVQDRWTTLLGCLPVRSAVHARQVHGAAVRLHRNLPPGLHLVPACDGHFTATPGLLLAISVADCVPIFLVAPGHRAVGAVHAGWRGAAAGILEAAVEAFRTRMGISAESLHMHMGPSICGACYEVGPEVFRALGEPEPPGPAPVDLPANLAARAVACGVHPSAVTRSGHCTLCGSTPLFSHRGGDVGRQMGIISVVTEA